MRGQRLDRLKTTRTSRRIQHKGSSDVSRVMQINGYMELNEDFRTPHADVEIESLDGRFFDDMKRNWTWTGLLWTE